MLYAFTLPDFRASAFGYFGHQWELYAFWTLVPSLLVLAEIAPAGAPALAGWAFAIIGIGAVGCVGGGYLSQRWGSARVAALALAISALCCAVYPLSATWGNDLKLLLFFVWGASVVADSPHFSALSARACPAEMVGSVLAFQNALGFAITMISIQLGSRYVASWGQDISWLLLPGPILGWLALSPLWRRSQ